MQSTRNKYDCGSNKIGAGQRTLAFLMPYYVALSKGILPKSVGLGKQGVAYVQSVDPCEYTGGGSVILETSRDGGIR